MVVGYRLSVLKLSDGGDVLCNRQPPKRAVWPQHNHQHCSFINGSTFPVITRAPRWNVTYAQAHCRITRTRLRKPMRKKMWMVSQAAQAMKPLSLKRPKSATPA